MLGVLCARPKPWLLTSLSHPSGSGGLAASYIHNRLTNSPIFRSVICCGAVDQRRHHSSSCRISNSSIRGGAASIWHAILPTGDDVDLRSRRKSLIYHHQHDELVRKGEGSWNVAWDARPARWLHNPESAWLLFGVCACLAAPLPPLFDASEVVSESSQSGSEKKDVLSSGEESNESSANFRVTGLSFSLSRIRLVYLLFDSLYVYYELNCLMKLIGVPADGRCLFRAIAHVACLRRGEEVPDENRQRELADELRAQVCFHLSWIKRFHFRLLVYCLI